MYTKDYHDLWEDIGRKRAECYLGYKFQPTYLIGLTNFLRETLICRFLDPQPQDVVLDAGCAAGRQLLGLAGKIKEGYGIDIAQSFIDEAKKTALSLGFKNLFFQVSTLEALTFQKQFFDKILCAEVLEHVFDAEAALSRLVEVLKDDGTLLITVPNLNADATWWGRLLRLLHLRRFCPLTDFSQTGFQAHGDAHVREFDQHSLIAFLERHGLRVAEIQSVSFVDGPFADFLMKFLLHVTLLRKIIIRLELCFTQMNLFWGRHLVVKAKKITYV